MGEGGQGRGEESWKEEVDERAMERRAGRRTKSRLGI